EPAWRRAMATKTVRTTQPTALMADAKCRPLSSGRRSPILRPKLPRPPGGRRGRLPYIAVTGLFIKPRVGGVDAAGLDIGGEALDVGLPDFGLHPVEGADVVDLVHVDVLHD